MDFLQEMGLKDLEHVVLKARDYINLGDHTFVPGEPILYFENIQIAMLSENARIVAAKGGYLNQPRVVWEDRDDTTFQFSNGTLNQLSLNMLLEANMLHEMTVYVPHKQMIDIDDSGEVWLSYPYEPTKKRFYKIFERENLQKTIKPISEEILDGQTLVKFDPEYAGKTIVADYYFVPKSGAITYTMDRERKPNLYTLEATFYLKDENEGLLHTGILEMPKVYIMSNINLRMGERADPTVGTFRIMAMPDNLDGHEATVCRITYLDEDIYGL